MKILFLVIFLSLSSSWSFGDAFNPTKSELGIYSEPAVSPYSEVVPPKENEDMEESLYGSLHLTPSGNEAGTKAEYLKDTSAGNAASGADKSEKSGN